MTFHQDPFFRVPRTAHPTRQGPVALPILYYDSTAVFAFFGCDGEAVEALLPPGRFGPAIARRRRALVGLALFEYRTTSIGPYNEVGLAVPVVWKSEAIPVCPAWEFFRSPRLRRVGYHIVDLPVTTETACAAGKELWGYPKFVTPIDVSLQRRQLRCRVHDPEGEAPIMTMEGTLGVGLPCPAMDLVTFECVGGQARRTVIQTRGGGRLHGAGDVRLRLGDASHPMAARLRRLALDGARPLTLWVSTRFQSRLNAGGPTGLCAIEE